MGKESKLCQRELLYDTAFYPFEPVHAVSINSTPLKLEFSPLGMPPRPVRRGWDGPPLWLLGHLLIVWVGPGCRGLVACLLLAAVILGFCTLPPLWGLHANQGRFSTWHPPPLAPMLGSPGGGPLAYADCLSCRTGQFIISQFFIYQKKGFTSLSLVCSWSMSVSVFVVGCSRLFALCPPEPTGSI